MKLFNLTKKYMLVLIVFISWVSMAGFTNISSVAMINNKNVASEAVTFTYDEITASTLDISMQDLKDELSSIAIVVKSAIESSFYNKVVNDISLTPEQKQNYLKVAVNSSVDDKNIIFETNYPTVAIWNYFADYNSNTTQIDIEKSLFLQTKTQTSTIRLSKIDYLGEKLTLGDFVYNQILILLKANHSSIAVDDLAKPLQTYSYVTRYHRVHTNANEVRFQDGYYVHTWSISSGNDTMSIWIDSANTPTWYVCALLLTIIVIVVILLMKDKTNSKTNDNNTVWVEVEKDKVDVGLETYKDNLEKSSKDKAED